MGETTAIPWTDKTWNPWQGCHKVSPGCKNCYMFVDKKRYGQEPDVVVRSKPPTFNAPLKWKGSAKVFTCSWSDFYVEEADPWRDEAYEIMEQTPHLTYQIPTKRIECVPGRFTRMENVWLGVSVEDRKYGLPRIEKLRDIDATVRFLSIEPLLEDLGPLDLRGIHWVIIGGEGYGGRPFYIEWARRIIAQCADEGVACLMKQVGAHPIETYPRSSDLVQLWPTGTQWHTSTQPKLRDRKGETMAEWPEALRVRQFPEVRG